MLSYGNGGIAVIGGGLIVVVADAAGLLRLRADPLDAVGLYAAASAVFLGLMSLAWLGDPPIPGPGLQRSDVSDALIVVAGCLLAFLIGARIWGPARRARLPSLSPQSM